MWGNFWGNFKVSSFKKESLRQIFNSIIDNYCITMIQRITNMKFSLNL